MNNNVVDMKAFKKKRFVDQYKKQLIAYYGYSKELQQEIKKEENRIHNRGN